MFTLRQCAGLIFLILTFFVSGEAAARQRESAIKSGFLYNFARYSQGKWFNPARESSYTICSFDPQFIDIATLTLKDRAISHIPVKLHLLEATFSGIADCNTLFISKKDTEQWADLIASNQLLKLKIMLVGELPDFIATGGHINFFIVGGKVRFEVDPDKLKASGIKMSSKVLRLGRPYKGGY